MCGRVNVSDNEGVRMLLEMLGMTTWPSRDPRFNIAPTQTLNALVSDENELVAIPMSWGVSMKVKGKRGQDIVKRVSNARDDKVWSSFLWRNLIPDQRVLVPVNGFYEWKRHNRKLVQAYHIHPAGSRAMFLAGIYRAAKTADEKPELSLVTTAANEAMQLVHDRMPVILSSQNEAMAWINESDKDTLCQLMRPASNEFLELTPVSDYVNKSTNEGSQCTEAVA